MSVIREHRCGNCGHGEDIPRGSWAMCSVDKKNPVKVVCWNFCDKWKVRKVEKKEEPKK